MKPLISILTPLATLALTACGLYTEAPRPVTEYDINEICQIDSLAPTIARLSWREMFPDPYLTAWIDSGLRANTDLRKAQLQVEQAEATLRASRLAFFPSVSVGADGTAGFNTTDKFTIGPSASWEVDIFGKQRNLKKGAEAAYYGSEAYAQAVRTQLIATIANSYYTLLMLDEQLDISERTIKTWDENLRTLQALKRAGRTNEAAVLQARANRMQVEGSAVTLRNQINEQENVMRSLLLNPAADLARGLLSEQEFPDSLSAGVPLSLLLNRPDVREAAYELQRCFYAINVSKAAFYPSLTLSGSAGWTTYEGTTVSNVSDWIASIAGSIAAPIFSKGTNEANLKIAQTNYEAASLDFQQTLLDAGIEVNNALSDWQTARERIALDKKQVVALKGAVNTTRLLMRNSTTNYLEVLTAQQRLLEAELSKTSDTYAAIQAIISLYHSLGGGTE
ncbi:MAG: TolC family protein [Bacteroidales bacterium]|nr:TolC family protein [Bacteroidales bacterium]